MRTRTACAFWLAVRKAKAQAWLNLTFSSRRHTRCAVFSLPACSKTARKQQLWNTAQLMQTQGRCDVLKTSGNGQCSSINRSCRAPSAACTRRWFGLWLLVGGEPARLVGRQARFPQFFGERLGYAGSCRRKSPSSEKLLAQLVLAAR